MSCKPRKKQKRKYFKKNNSEQANTVNADKNPYNLEDLTETGILQYFYHSKSSRLPIRDILDEHEDDQKTEPHIEIGAENYLKECYQTNIKNFAFGFNEKWNGRYIFLVTTCSNLEEIKQLEENMSSEDKAVLQGSVLQYVVGYIDKKDAGFNKDEEKKKRHFVKGITHLYPFQYSYLVKKLFGKNFSQIPSEKTFAFKIHLFVDEDKTKILLDHFQKVLDKELSLYECVREMIKLEKEKKKIDSSYNPDKYCLQQKCKYRKECLRRVIYKNL